MIDPSVSELFVQIIAELATGTKSAKPAMPDVKQSGITQIYFGLRNCKTVTATVAERHDYLEMPEISNPMQDV